MSKILLIEPDKMLRQALIVALFPEHQVGRVLETIPDNVACDYDAMIVDGAALRTKALLSEHAIRALELSGVPLIWIDNAMTMPAPARDKIVRLCLPVAKEGLRRALAQCLESSPLQDRAATIEMPSAHGCEGPEARSLESAVTGNPDPFIELVDVVDEDTAEEQGRSS